MQKIVLRFSTANLVLMLLATSPAGAIDWDGDFPNSRSFDGKFYNPDNWEFDTLPGLGVGVNFNANATYTVFFGTDFETSGGVGFTGVENGDVTFETLGGTPTYAINGFFTVNSMLTVDGVNLDSGQNNPLSLTVINGAELDIQSGPLPGSFLIGRFAGTTGTVSIFGGSSVTVDGLFGLGDLSGIAGNGVLKLASNNSSFEVTAGNNAQIGGDSASIGRFRAGNNTQADFGGGLNVRATGTLENFGAAITVAGAAQIDGRFAQSGGTTFFNETVNFGSSASLNHTAGRSASATRARSRSRTLRSAAR